MRPAYLLLPLALYFGAALPAAQAQQSPAAAPAKPMYGSARIWVLLSYCQLSLSDGVNPAGPFDYVRENGKPRRFADQAAALNYLYALGWDVQPQGFEESRFYYLLKRRTP
ncbi:hypothetical protein J0X19_21980 [Hymenobacter sp. BT186]|uniref:Uncharacterized protein n=1 Tax=Hymenobacter telluris TaxID=2816474 RepID=A0A939F017_9BACT|nr:hypothetical protein [Hymenobacter telluris]MBO0360645.1 hypothetical protein [Hymenobacter telluris]MBW3376672.1 hypothetical protein [Hymenobacter norwichensis]